MFNVARCGSLRLARAVAVTGVVVAVGLPASMASADAVKVGAKACQPTGGRISEQVTRQADSQGSQLTEFLPGSAYKVTTCDASGRPQSSITVAQIDGPGGQPMRVPIETTEGGETRDALYPKPDGPQGIALLQQAKAQIAEQPSLVPAPTPGTQVQEAIPAPAAGARTAGTNLLDANPLIARTAKARTARTHRGPVAHAASGGDSCSNPAYVRSPMAQQNYQHGWWWNSASFGNNSSTLTALTNAELAWDHSANACGIPDTTPMTSYYWGNSTATPTVHDGVSVLTKGDTNAYGCPGALACTFRQTNPYPWIDDADIVFSTAVSWSNVNASGTYDYMAVAVHEDGHALGLDHETSSYYLAMYPQTGMNELFHRDLGRGDILGLAAIYPTP
jgi:hypothetical protein